MIIECINCNKVFEVNSELIPENGRTIQCGSCNHVWFYNPKIADIKKEIKQNDEINVKEKPNINQTKKANYFILKNAVITLCINIIIKFLILWFKIFLKKKKKNS